MKPTLTTAESSGSTLRLAIVCNASTICAPITNGSMPRCGCAACVPRPLMRMSQRSEAASSGPGSRRDLADRDARLVVHRKDRIARKFVEQPLLDHDPAAAAALFGRLKDQMHGALEVAGRGEVSGGAEQHRRVPVMAAGVHLAVFGRAVGEIVHLVDRQRVHIGAQPDRRRRIAAPDRADDPGPGEPAMHLAAELGELGRDQVGGALLGEGEFGMGVDVAADRGQFVVIVAAPRR